MTQRKRFLAMITLITLIILLNHVQQSTKKLSYKYQSYVDFNTSTPTIFFYRFPMEFRMPTVTCADARYTCNLKYDRNHFYNEVNSETDSQYLKSADVVVINPIFSVFQRNPSQINKLQKLLFQIRQSNQIYLFFQLESPALHYINMTSFNGVFNKTATYRFDSDYTANYPFDNGFLPWLKNRKLPEKKYAVLVMISNCESNYRNNIIRELNKKLRFSNGTPSFDVLGQCTTNGVFDRTAESKNRLKNEKWALPTRRGYIPYRDYKFYLSIENARCKDYISEKFINPILDGTVPIVAGASRSAYEKIVPGSSFIHVDDFESLNALADRINFLVENNDEYEKYFDWWKMDDLVEKYGSNQENYPKQFFWDTRAKEDGTFNHGENSVWCDVCKDAWKAKTGRLEKKDSIVDFEYWWNGQIGQKLKGTCEIEDVHFD